MSTYDILDHVDKYYGVKIPTGLDMTTKDRLLLVADIIETVPEKHSQGSWISGVDYQDTGPKQVLGFNVCGTSMCVAGWAVCCSPVWTQIPEIDDEGFGDATMTAVKWGRAGAELLGLEDDLADFLFEQWVSGDFPEALRLLAELPEPRTYEAAKDAGLFALIDYTLGGDEDDH